MPRPLNQSEAIYSLTLRMRDGDYKKTYQIHHIILLYVPWLKIPRPPSPTHGDQVLFEYTFRSFRSDVLNRWYYSQQYIVSIFTFVSHNICVAGFLWIALGLSGSVPQGRIEFTQWGICMRSILSDVKCEILAIISIWTPSTYDYLWFYIYIM